MTEPLPVIRTGRRPSPPVFDRIGIVGLGLIGGSLALAVKREWPASLVIGVDRKPIIERATEAHAIDVGADDLGMVSEAELIVLAAPVDENLRILEELRELVRGDAIVTDVGSTKRAIGEAAKRLPAHLNFIGGHPMAGAAVGGFEHARPDLFAGLPWILDSNARADPARLIQFLTAIGAVCTAISAEHHDHLVAFLSDLPQLTASALMHVVGEAVGKQELRLAGRGLQDSTRLATSPATVWKPLVRSNADEIRPALDALIDVLTRLRADLERGEFVERLFESAQRWKSEVSGGR